MSRLEEAMRELREQTVEVKRAQEGVEYAKLTLVQAQELLDMVTADFVEAQKEAVEAAQEFAAQGRSFVAVEAAPDDWDGSQPLT